MSKDEKPLQRIFDRFNPLVREGWTVDRIVDSVNGTTFFFGDGTSVYSKKSEFTVDRTAPAVCASTRIGYLSQWAASTSSTATASTCCAFAQPTRAIENPS